MVASHMLPLPTAFLGLRIAQLVVGIVVLGLAAYGVTFIAFDGDSLILFTSLATMIITIYNLVSILFLPTAYNYWAILALDIFAVIFWLISFALLGAEIAAFGWGTYGYATDYDGCTAYDIAYGYCARRRSVSLFASRAAAVEKRATTDVYTYRNSMAAAAGLGGLEFLLFIVTLIFTSIYLHRHRKAGGHSSPNHMATSTTTSGNNNNNNVPVIHEPKNDVELQQGQHQQPVYTQHTQQPVQYPVQPQEISTQQHQHVAA